MALNYSQIDEMSKIYVKISAYPGYERIASSLSKFLPQNIVAGLVGCIIPESGTNHRILNSQEYYGNGKPGTEGWNCGEGLVQWTFWKYKEPLIKAYNLDSRSTQKLPETWGEYSMGTPVKSGKYLIAPEDGKHISGLTLDNQMLFLTKYYNDLISKLENMDDISVITAKIYQQKAGNGYFTNISDPIERAYVTADKKYPSTSGNHFLKSLKVALQYNETVGGQDPVGGDDFNPFVYSNSEFKTNDTNIQHISNIVSNLSMAGKTRNDYTQLDDSRKTEFESLRNTLVSNTPDFGREINLTDEIYGPNILKGDQESKKERN